MVRDILIVGVFLTISTGIIILAGIRDNTIQPKKFDCRMLVGSWHPDVPQEVIKECRNRNKIMSQISPGVLA
jgi:hypothetical protein